MRKGYFREDGARSLMHDWSSDSCAAPHPAMRWLLLLLCIITLIGLYQSTNYRSVICQSTWRRFKGHVILKIRFTAEWSHDFVGGRTAIDTTSRRAILPLKSGNKLLSINISQSKENSVYLSTSSLEDCLLKFQFSNYTDLSPLLHPTKLLFRCVSSDCTCTQEKCDMLGHSLLPRAQDYGDFKIPPGRRINIRIKME